MKYIKYLLITLFFSCKTIEITEIKKQIVTPGLPSGVIVLKYSGKFTTTENTLIKSISVSGISKPISTFTITNLTDGLLLQQNEILKKGEYYIEFKTDWKKELENSIDTVKFITEINGKEKTISKVTTKNKDILMK